MFFETLKVNLLIIIFFGVVGALGYWAVNSLQVDPEEFESQLVDVRPIIQNEPTGYMDNSNTGVQASTPEVPTTPVQVTTTPSATGEHAELKSALQKLIDDNVLMKEGSKGTRVGTVQEFLNIYNGTDSKKDNDFGATTTSQVKAFQKAEGLSADGQAGPGTYKKMIDWLDK